MHWTHPLLGLILACNPLLSWAQQQLGWRLDNHAGINSALLNPAAPLTSPYAWDLNLAEASMFAANNYAYLRDGRAGQLLRADANTRFVSAPDFEGEPNPDDLVVDYFQGSRARFAVAHVAVLGPALSVQVAPYTRIGVYTRAQALVSARQVDGDFSYYPYLNRPTNTPFTVSPMGGAVAGWTELALNLAQGIPTYAGQWNLGFSARRLWGYSGGYFDSERAFVYNRPSPTDISGQAPTLAAGFTDHWIDDTNELTRSVNGQGWGLDVGVQFLANNDGEAGYRWKVGVSVLDLGQLRFDQQAQAHRLEVDDLAQLNTDNYRRFEQTNEFNDLVRQFSQDVLGDSSASRTGDAFALGLPTTLNLQGEINVAPGVFVGAVFTTSLAPSLATLERGAMLAVAARWESHWWGVSMPLSWYEYQQLRLGLAVRLGPLTLGSDHVWGWLGQSRLSGADAYLALKVFPWGLHNGRSRARQQAPPRRGRGRQVKCFEF